MQAGVTRDTWEHPDEGVAPGPGPGPVTIQSIVLPPTVSLALTGTAYGMITLSGPAPAEGAIVELTKTVLPPGAAMNISFWPPQVTIAANSNSAGFSIKCTVSDPVSVSVSVVVTATLGASQVSANVTFTP